MEEQEKDSSIHQRMLVLRDLALGVNKSSKIDPTLTPACYDSSVDSLLALHDECSKATGLSKNKNVSKFVVKYKGTVEAVQQLRIKSSDFEVKGIIGRGHFGEVQVVEEKSTKEVYAMKIMKKEHILQQADSACFSEERDIMAWASSPWLTSLHYAFQDSSSLYLVMDYHPGGDLLTVMERRDGRMSEREARFYLSEIAAGLDDLHQLRFVHRDVKPENVLISRSGHIKLVDFGSAARLGDNGKVVDSHLPVGTPEYIAPEVLTSLDKSTGDYGVCCDWWSLGIIAYELLYVCTPFEGDSTTVTYGNIMNYKDNLSFPDDVSVSEEFQSLIKNLLTKPDKRLSFNQLKSHPFFNSVNWQHLPTVLPPYIPSVSSPADISNFDEFEPKKEDSLSAGLQSKTQREFSGKSLPFVGFTFTRFSHTQLDFTDSEETGVSVGDGTGQRWLLEKAQGQVRELKERNRFLEKECVVYQNQLKESCDSLERERVDRRRSDADARKLLEEVKVHSETLRELRKEELSEKEVELNCVVTQLEQDRQVVANKARRLQTELESVSQERDLAVKVAVELKAKLKALKENSKKDIASLQSRLDKLSRDSSTQATSLHEKLTEQHVTASKKLKSKEDSEKKLQQKIKKLESAASNHRQEKSQLKNQLDTKTREHNERVKWLEAQIASLTTEKSAALQECEGIKQTNRELRTELKEAKLFKQTSETRVKTENEMAQGLQDQVRGLQRKLSETGQTAIKQSEKLREARDTKRKLDLENSDLRTKLRKIEADKERVERQLKSKSEKVSELGRLKTELAKANEEIASLQDSSKVVAAEVDEVKDENTRLISEKKKTEVTLQSVRDKLTTEELNCALVQRKLKLVEEELTEAKTALEELTAADTHWKAVKATMTSDLETAESRLDDALASIDKERDSRVCIEQKQQELLGKFEKMQSSHHEEVRELRRLLDSQREQVSVSSKKVLTVEKELMLTELSLKQTQKDLATEKACYSKISEDQYALHRDYRILKAAYNKLHREHEEQRAQLTLTSEVRDRVLNEQKSAAETHQLQETRMQSTIEQQGKLIDYLQEVGTSPRRRGLGKLAKGLKLSRKGRDPAKDIAEWNKLKGFIAKPHKNANKSQLSASHEVSQSSSTSSLSSLDPIPSIESTLSVTPATSSTRTLRSLLSSSHSESAKVTKSAILSFPVTTLSKKNASKKQDTSSTELDTSSSSVKENVAASGNLVERTGRKRKHSASMSTDSDLQEPAEKVLTVRHNIPHNFALHRTGIHKTHKCSACKEQIKNFQRFAKCRHCHLICHNQCIDSLPNNCGLPAELASHTLPPPPPSTSKTINDKKVRAKAVRVLPMEAMDEMVDSSVEDSFANEVVVASTPIVAVNTDFVKSERLTLLRGSLKTMGWLVLKKKSILFYDRNPDNAITRKPLCSFDFTSTDGIFQTLSDVQDRNGLYNYSDSQISKIFGLRKYSSNSLDHQEVLFLAPTLQCKIDWVEAIGEVFASLSAAKEELVYGDAVDSENEGRALIRKRSLKAVSIVPIKTSRLSTGTTKSDSLLGFSIHSSMLEDSDSDDMSDV